jgi:hypothetical protein
LGLDAGEHFSLGIAPATLWLATESSYARSAATMQQLIDVRIRQLRIHRLARRDGAVIAEAWDRLSQQSLARPTAACWPSWSATLRRRRLRSLGAARAGAFEAPPSACALREKALSHAFKLVTRLCTNWHANKGSSVSPRCYSPASTLSTASCNVVNRRERRHGTAAVSKYLVD